MLQSLDSLFLPPPPLCVLPTAPLKPKPNDSDTGVHEMASMSPRLLQCLQRVEVFMTKITFGGPRMGFIMNPHPSVLCISGRWGMHGLEYWSFQKNPVPVFFFLENSLKELLNSKIRFDFKEAPALICIGIAFFLHPQFTHFHVFPLSVTCSAVSKRNTIPLSVFIWCADSAAQAEKEWERERRNKKETKGERTVRLTSEKQEFSLSAWSLCRVCCFWKKCTEDSWLLQHSIILACAYCKEVCVTFFVRTVCVITVVLQTDWDVDVVQLCVKAKVFKPVLNKVWSFSKCLSLVLVLTQSIVQMEYGLRYFCCFVSNVRFGYVYKSR